MADLAGANGQREKFRVVGQPNIPGKLSYALATGVAKFGIDYVLPEMLCAKFYRSPYANARVLSVDTSAARAIAGVVDILTWEEDDIKNLKSFGESMGSPRVWLDNYADAEGQETAVIVVAENDDICEAALRALKFEWEIMPALTNLHEARKPDAHAIRPHVATPGGMGAPPLEKVGNVAIKTLASGDLEAGFAEADHVIEYDLYMPPFAAHLPNPSGSVAWWEDDFYSGEGKTLHIEGAVRERRAISQMYGMSLDRTVQEGLFMGGKYCDWGLRKSQEITPLLSKRTGRPVRCMNTREETFDFITKERYMYLKVGFTKDGLITAMDDFSIADGGSWGSSTFGNSGDMTYGPYNTLKCQNVRQQMEIVDSNRGIMYVSGQHCPFNWDIVTMAIYLISEELGMDPIDVTRLNLHGPESQDDMNPVPSFEVCVETGKKLMNWEPHRAGTKRLPDGRLHGAAFRYQMCPRHSFSGYNSKLEFKDGRVRMPTQGPLFGVFAVECNAMVVAEELGLEYDDVDIIFDYREKFTPVGGGSDGTTASAWVTKECANILKAKLLEAAIAEADAPPNPMMFMFGGTPEPSPFKGLTIDDIDLEDGCVIVKADPTKRKPLAQAVPADVTAHYSGRPPMAVWAVGFGKILDTMNIAFCEVAVDEETGEVEILRFGVVADPGKVMRPTSLESQIDQVMYFSQGCQLLEDYVYDPATGVKLNNNMIDYHKPTLLDVPPVERKFLETRAGNAAYGANGISHSLANTHLVIIALHNAIGKWVNPPATPDVVLKALGKA